MELDSKQVADYSERIEEKNMGIKIDFSAITNLTGLVSALALSVSISFEVGYFYGIDINMFTLFAFSEHVLFTLEAIPFAFAFFLATIPNIIFPHRWFAQRLLRGSASVFGVRRELYGSFVVMFVVCLVYIWFILYFLPNILLLTLFMIAYPVVSAVLYFRIRKDYRHVAFLSLSYGFVVVVSFLLGHMIARSYVSDGGVLHTITLKGLDDVSGRIIRSGDKGVLFFDNSSRHINFLKWENIEKISTKID
ncbi:hypothetical protein [Methylocystis sp. Sn-Cys]|uniref:hypothetical protein n=1 Tax=Methylocystis sp. Sn-Cys TaxID=1701263 RepID=UPI001921D4DE|nr:hypothetical protein [Methylocystis sp. Sn-Cys]MBL1256267.1 hypothetical protein [Methylocystis sp. Sn-Cys]